MDFRPGRFAHLTHDASARCGKNLKQIWTELNALLIDFDQEPIEYTNFANKVNPNIPNNNLTPLQWALFLMVTDLEPLDYLEGCLNRIAFDIPKAEIGALPMAAKAGKAAERFGNWLQKVGEVMSPGSDGGTAITPKEAAELIGEGDEVMQIFAKARAYLLHIKNGS